MHDTTTEATDWRPLYPKREAIYSLADIRAVMEGVGSFWWSPATRRFFGSRCSTEQSLYKMPDGKLAFISSERRPPSPGETPIPPRRWTVRLWDPERWGERGGCISDLGEFQAHGSRSSALRAIRKAGGVILSHGVKLV